MRQAYRCIHCAVISVSERDRETCPLCGGTMREGLPAGGVYSPLTDAERHAVFGRLMTQGHGVQL
jgi:hypothetical protein